jgi:uncharacterized BrkB/YihY/UPF0761 family membrane protein
MSNFDAFWWIALGVFVGVVYPLLLGFIKKEFPVTTAGAMPPWLKRYGGLLIFCLLTALLVLIFYRSSNPDAQLDWIKAFLLGFGWESLVEKSLGRPNAAAPNPAPKTTP